MAPSPPLSCDLPDTRRRAESGARALFRALFRALLGPDAGSWWCDSWKKVAITSAAGCTSLTKSSADRSSVDRPPSALCELFLDGDSTARLLAARSACAASECARALATCCASAMVACSAASRPISACTL